MADEDATAEEDPSIEEILDSIRQIISEDEDEQVSPAAEESPVGDSEDVPEEPAVEAEPEPIKEEEAVPEPEEEPEEEVILELTDKIIEVNEGPEEAVPEPGEEPEEEVEIQVDLRDIEEQDADADADVVSGAVGDDSLLTEAAESAALTAMTRLARGAAVDRTGVTIEDIVREEIRPMLKDWLDRNLPNLIERLVQDELQRVSSRVLEEE